MLYKRDHCSKAFLASAAVHPICKKEFGEKEFGEKEFGEKEFGEKEFTNTVPSTRAFTLVELLVVVGILAVLAAVLLPVFFGVRESGRRTSCLSNLHQIDLALTAYTQDHGGFFPPALTPQGDWAGQVAAYAPAKEVFRCPSCPVPTLWDQQAPGLPPDTAKGYALNGSLYEASIKDNPAISEARVRSAASTVAVCEFAYRSLPGDNASSYPSALMGPDDGTELTAAEKFIGTAGASRHKEGSNYAFVDGHAKWYLPGQVARANGGNDGTRPSFAL